MISSDQLTDAEKDCLRELSFNETKSIHQLHPATGLTLQKEGVDSETPRLTEVLGQLVDKGLVTTAGLEYRLARREDVEELIVKISV